MSAKFKWTARIVGAGVASVALGWMGYAAREWLRYGRRNQVTDSDDPLLESFIPVFEVRERCTTRVAAPAAVTYAVARDMNLLRSPVVHGILRSRELLLRSISADRELPRQPLVEQVLELGWVILAEAPGREIVLGAVTQPWKADVEFRGVSPSEFAAFDEPGWVKIVWTLCSQAVTPDESVFVTETRVATTDPVTRARFRRYWAVFSPGIRLIRREGARIVRRDAERQYADDRPRARELEHAGA